MAKFPSIPKVDYADVAGYREALRPLVQPWLKQAWIAILDPIGGKTQVENALTGVIESVTWTPAWAGWARVKSLRNPLNLKRAIDSTETRTVQFQPLDYPADNTLPDIRPGWEIVVMDCEADPYMVDYQYYVLGAMNSSEAWNRTIDCQVNQETVPGYDTSGWPQPPGGGS